MLKDLFLADGLTMVLVRKPPKLSVACPLTFSLPIKAIKVNSINPSAGFTANALMLFEKRKD